MNLLAKGCFSKFAPSENANEIEEEMKEFDGEIKEKKEDYF